MEFLSWKYYCDEYIEEGYKTSKRLQASVINSDARESQPFKLNK